MPYYYVEIEYFSKNTGQRKRVTGFDISEERVREEVAEPFLSQKQFVFFGRVIDPRLIEKIDIVQLERRMKDTLVRRRRVKLGGGAAYEDTSIGMGTVIEEIRRGKIGKNVTSNFMTVIPERPKNELTIEIFKVISLIENSLRKIIRDKPERESEINDSLEDLFIGAGLDGSFSREKESIPYSNKKYIPDFVFDNIGAVVETKFVDKKGKDKEIVGQINDDIVAYKSRYPNLIFVVYDMGIIRNVDMFKNSIENQESVIVKVIKH
jgi:hypothetical protein